MSEGVKFDRIVLGARGTSQEGTLNISETGISWKKKGVRFPTHVHNCTSRIITCFSETSGARLEASDEA